MKVNIYGSYLQRLHRALRGGLQCLDGFRVLRLQEPSETQYLRVPYILYEGSSCDSQYLRVPYILYEGSSCESQ